MKSLFSWRTFRAPLLLAFMTLIGLVSGLLGDLAWDWLSWIALLLPLAIIVHRSCT